MIKLLNRVLIVVSSFLMFVFGVAVVVPVRADVIYGRVVDVSNQPVSGVSVDLLLDTLESATVVTDGKGLFSTDGNTDFDDTIVEGTTVTATCVKSKYITTVVDHMIPSNEEFSTRLTGLVMVKGTGTTNLSTVTVVTGTSTVVKGAMVRCARAGVVPEVRYTNGYGVCTFQGLREKEYAFRVSKPGFVTKKVFKTVSDGDADVNITLVAE